MSEQYEPLSEAELAVLIKECQLLSVGPMTMHRSHFHRLTATIRDLQGQASKLTWENKAMRDSIANVMAAYEAAPDRALTYDCFKEIMADTIVRGTP